MPKWVEKSLITIAIAMAALFAGAIFYRAIFGIIVFYEIGKEELTRGEILNFISILVAIFAAVGGWILTSKLRQNEIKRLVKTESRVIKRLADAERAEAERIAKADAVILCRKLNSASEYALALLVHVTMSPFGNLLKLPSGLRGEAARELPELLKWLQTITKHVQEHLPDTARFFGDLRPLYLYETTFGDHFMKIILVFLELEHSLREYSEADLTGTLATYEKYPNSIENDFFRLIKCAADVCVGQEYSRRMLNGIRFNLTISEADFIGYGNYFYEAIGEKNPFGGGGVDADDYLKLLEATADLCADRAKETEFSLYEE